MASRKRRSSILKTPKARAPLCDLEFNPQTPTETATTKSRRVSFSRKKGVVEFVAEEATTTWKNFYVEQNNHTLDVSDNDSGPSSAKVHVGGVVGVRQHTFTSDRACVGDISRELNITERMAAMEGMNDRTFLPAQQSIEINLIGEHMELFPGGNITDNFGMEVSGKIDIELSDVQPVFNNFSSEDDEFLKKIRQVEEMDRIHAANLTEQAGHNMSLTDIVAGAQRIDSAFGGREPGIPVLDKENIPVARIEETPNPKRQEHILVFDGRNVKYESINQPSKRTEDIQPESIVEKAFQLKSRNRKTIVFQDEEANMSITQAVGHNIIVNKPCRNYYQSMSSNEKTVYDNVDVSMTKVVQPNRRTICGEVDVSLTEMIPHRVIDNRHCAVHDNANLTMNSVVSGKYRDLSSTARLNNPSATMYDADLSMTRPVPSLLKQSDLTSFINNRVIDNADKVGSIEPLQQRRKTVCENNTSISELHSDSRVRAQNDLTCHQGGRTIFDSNDLSMTEVIKSGEVNVFGTDLTKVIGSHTIFENNDLSMTEVVKSGKVTVGSSDLTRTIGSRTIFENNDLSMTEVVKPGKANVGSSNLTKTIGSRTIFENNDLSMTEVVKPDEVKVGSSDLTKTIGSRTIFENNDLSMTEVVKPGEVKVGSSDMTKAIGSRTIFENNDLSMTEVVKPGKVTVGSSDLTKTIGSRTIFENNDLSMTEVVKPGELNVGAHDMNKESGRRTIFENNYLSMIKVVESSRKKDGSNDLIKEGGRRTIFDSNNSSMTEVVNSGGRVHVLNSVLNNQPGGRILHDINDLSATDVVKPSPSPRSGQPGRKTIHDSCDLSMTSVIQLEVKPQTNNYSLPSCGGNTIYDKCDSSMAEVIRPGMKTLIDNCDISMTEVVDCRNYSFESKTNQAGSTRREVMIDDNALSTTGAIKSNQAADDLSMSPLRHPVEDVHLSLTRKAIGKSSDMNVIPSNIVDSRRSIFDRSNSSDTENVAPKLSLFNDEKVPSTKQIVIEQCAPKTKLSLFNSSADGNITNCDQEAVKSKEFFTQEANMKEMVRVIDPATCRNKRSNDTRITYCESLSSTVDSREMLSKTSAISVNEKGSVVELDRTAKVRVYDTNNDVNMTLSVTGTVGSGETLSEDSVNKVMEIDNRDEPVDILSTDSGMSMQKGDSSRGVTPEMLESNVTSKVAQTQSYQIADKSTYVDTLGEDINNVMRPRIVNIGPDSPNTSHILIRKKIIEVKETITFETPEKYAQCLLEADNLKNLLSIDELDPAIYVGGKNSKTKTYYVPSKPNVDIVSIRNIEYKSSESSGVSSTNSSLETKISRSDRNLKVNIAGQLMSDVTGVSDVHTSEEDGTNVGPVCPNTSFLNEVTVGHSLYEPKVTLGDNYRHDIEKSEKEAILTKINTNDNKNNDSGDFCKENMSDKPSIDIITADNVKNAIDTECLRLLTSTLKHPEEFFKEDTALTNAMINGCDTMNSSKLPVNPTYVVLNNVSERLAKGSSRLAVVNELNDIYPVDVAVNRAIASQSRSVSRAGHSPLARSPERASIVTSNTAPPKSPLKKRVHFGAGNGAILFDEINPLNNILLPSPENPKIPEDDLIENTSNIELVDSSLESNKSEGITLGIQKSDTRSEIDRRSQCSGSNTYAVPKLAKTDVQIVIIEEESPSKSKIKDAMEEQVQESQDQIKSAVQNQNKSAIQDQVNLVMQKQDKSKIKNQVKSAMQDQVKSAMQYQDKSAMQDQVEITKLTDRNLPVEIIMNKVSTEDFEFVSCDNVISEQVESAMNMDTDKPICKDGSQFCIVDWANKSLLDMSSQENLRHQEDSMMDLMETPSDRNIVKTALEELKVAARRSSDDQCRDDVEVCSTVSLINKMPFSSEICQWETRLENEWSFLLLHSIVRLRVIFQSGVVTNETPIKEMEVENLADDTTHPCGHLTAKCLLARIHPSNVMSKLDRCQDVPTLLSYISDVTAQAMRWSRAMHRARLLFAYNLNVDGRLSYDIANTDVCTVWRVSMYVTIDERNPEAFPLAEHVVVKTCWGDCHVYESEVNTIISHVRRGWDHVPAVIRNIAKMLRSKRIKHSIYDFKLKP